MHEKYHPTAATEAGDLWLDESCGCLRRGPESIELRPKTLAVLRYLITRGNEVVCHTELQQAVWPDTVVTPGVLRNCILELRTALAQPLQAQPYIETVPRRGYRLLVPIPTHGFPAVGWNSYGRAPLRGQAPVPQPETLVPLLPSDVASAPDRAPHLVSRAGELGRLDGWLAKALQGERQTIFVTGEPGIGKTVLADAFADRAARQGLWVAHGQCIEQYGVGEAYLPFLEALSSLGGHPRQQHVVSVLRQYAPTWLAALPGLLPPEARTQCPREHLGSSPERRPRELGEALEALTAEVPLVLVLEDLHWCDPATLDLLSFLARRRPPARLLVLGTFRPSEVLARQHPLNGLVQELRMHERCEELPLSPFSQQAVEEYVSARLARGALPAGLVPALYRRTEGNPFFLVKFVDELISRGVVHWTAQGWQVPAESEQLAALIPDQVCHLVEKQLDRLSPDERGVLEVASVVGVAFSAAAVAPVLKQEIAHVEEQCEQLARRHHFLQAECRGRPLERRESGRYRFVHSLYREVIYSQLTAGQHASFHRQIGIWKEAVFGGRVQEQTVELATHFEHGHDYPRALYYRRQAAQLAIRRYAMREALTHLTRSLELLRTLPDTPERTEQELWFHIATLLRHSPLSLYPLR